jgi:hypothetical protein
MKRTLSRIVLLSSLLIVASCNDFEEINENPLAVTAEQVEVEFFINKSIGDAQQNPHIAERIFFLYWTDGGRSERMNVVTTGRTNDGWTHDYFTGYMGRWLTDINSAVTVAEEKIAGGNANEYTNNMLQIARIWRVYLMSEMTDTFGPIPIDGFQGINPEYSSVEAVYNFMLAELADATTSLDENNTFKPSNLGLDPAYGFDYTKWKRYGNSMRMRLAMRLSEVNPSKAQSEFEAAVGSGMFIAAPGDDMKVVEQGGWNSYTNVLSRQWNSHYMSSTYRNLTVGLGGVASTDQLDASLHGNVKPAGDLGLRFDDHMSLLTNDPNAGFWLDGLPNTVDPRAYVNYPIPGNLDDSNYNNYPTWNSNTTVSERDLLDDNGDVLMTIDGAFTWNAIAGGDGGEKLAKNRLIWSGSYPRLGHRFRSGNEGESRFFFASWESHFLIAEAAVRGWSVPMSGQAAYEAGISDSFNYFGVSQHLGAYLASEDYNNVGTSVSWTHTTEPPASVTMNFVDGYTSTPDTFEFTYPENTIYEGGSVKNDLLTKIITQKYLAQGPWLPLEKWSDHRRLGLPFFDNPAVENPLPDMPQLNAGNVMVNSVNHFGQRVKYPSSFANNVPDGYSQAVQHLGGDDSVWTPLWWAKQN